MKYRVAEYGDGTFRVEREVNPVGCIWHEIAVHKTLAKAREHMEDLKAKHTIKIKNETVVKVWE